MTSFYVFILYALTLYISDGPDNLCEPPSAGFSPKILSLPFEPQDNAFLSWAHPYAAFHNQSNCWVCGVLPSSSVEAFTRWASPLQERTFSKSETTFDNNNHMWCLFLIWWHLTNQRWTGATLCTLTMDIIWLLTLLIGLFLLFAPWICNCVAGFVSSCMKAFKLQMAAQTPVIVVASSNYYFGPMDQRPSIWGLGKTVASQFRNDTPLSAQRQLWNKNDVPFPRHHNSPKRKVENERVTGRKAIGLQMGEIVFKYQTF